MLNNRSMIYALSADFEKEKKKKISHSTHTLKLLDILGIFNIKINYEKIENKTKLMISTTVTTKTS